MFINNRCVQSRV